jgi:hypothetical protein
LYYYIIRCKNEKIFCCCISILYADHCRGGGDYQSLLSLAVRQKTNQKVSAMSIIINSFLLTVLMFAAGAFITKSLGWDKEE